MASASVNPAVSDLLQTLSSLNSPVLSSQAVVSALEKAPASDIVRLSAEASQLEGVEAMFGLSNSSGSSDSSDSLTSALASLENTADAAAGSTAGASSSATSSSSASSSAAQLASYQATLQSDEAEALLGGETGSGATGSLFDLTG